MRKKNSSFWGKCFYVYLIFWFQFIPFKNRSGNVGSSEKIPIVTITKIFLFILVIFCIPLNLKTQDCKNYRILFYNVENLFDTMDDTLTNDDEFLPEGNRHWDSGKFYTKLKRIYKVLMAVGEWEPPSIVGLSEIENRYVLNRLLYDTPLQKFDYRIIHAESPDRRGIDVAMLYRSNQFTPDTFFTIPVRFPFDRNSTTRDILYVKGFFGNEDTLHLFVNHWPSRYGGYVETQPKRNYVAGLLKTKTDSILSANPFARIIIMGDLNDGPYELSLTEMLDAKIDTTENLNTRLYNLVALNKNRNFEGTLKYRQSWDIFDQIIVSGSILGNKKRFRISDQGFLIYSAEFLLEEDNTHMGYKPFRTYSGFKYNNGFSDHLPVYIDVLINCTGSP